MGWYYISHPYTGNEEKNRAEAAEIQRKMQELYPDMLFINPLAMFQPLKDMPYEKVMDCCIEMLLACDGIIMTGDYQESCGCRKELEIAEERGMHIRGCTANGEICFLPRYQYDIVGGSFKDWADGKFRGREQ
nr:MAG TPA: N-deoxyribosyltransferase [Caudoviricetes sp.]